MCVSGFRILKKIENWFTNEGAIVIFVRCVFNKNSIDIERLGQVDTIYS